jgi:hypothetical protein
VKIDRFLPSFAIALTDSELPSVKLANTETTQLEEPVREFGVALNSEPSRETDRRLIVDPATKKSRRECDANEQSAICENEPLLSAFPQLNNALIERLEPS